MAKTRLEYMSTEDILDLAKDVVENEKRALDESLANLEEIRHELKRNSDYLLLNYNPN